MESVLQVKYLGDYRLELIFTDGLRGEVNLESELYGTMFEPLKDVELFKQVRADQELSTIAWPNGADLAPEYLYEKTLASQQAAIKRAA
jgi:hypothetical protein